ncbi:MAG: hypothetical protein QM755_24430 [Luteolibacter sp.]
MQLTRLDRWLRETFVLQTQIYTMRAVEPLPRGMRHEELPEQPGRRFKHRYIARRSRDADKFIAILKHNGQMFTTRIIDREAWYRALHRAEEQQLRDLVDHHHLRHRRLPPLRSGCGRPLVAGPGNAGPAARVPQDSQGLSPRGPYAWNP